MDPIRLACVRYLNTAPLIHGLDRLRGLTLIPAAPAEIAGLVASGDADLGLASVVDAVNSPAEMCLFPVGMIGCDGATLTVRVFSRRPLAQITTLAADVESHTSVILARLILARTLGVRPDVTPYISGAGSQWPDAVLLIGDKVIVNHPPEHVYPHQLDLGLAWQELTGLPFVYAMWMSRADRASSASVRLGAEILERQRRHNATRTEWIVRTYAPRAGWPVDTARHYLRDLLRYEVTERALAAAHLFVKMAGEEGLLRTDRALRVAPPTACSCAPLAAR